MTHHHRAYRGVVFALLPLLAAVGCATTASPPRERVQFAPTPIAEVGTQDLAPVQPRSEYELLSEANDAFRKANSAQEQQDHEAALRHYNHMLELLIEADLDPTVYYNLRSEFERILDRTTVVAKRTDREPEPRWDSEAMEFTVKSQLEFPDPLNARVVREIEEIETVYPKTFQAGLNRASKYLPYIREEFRKAGLPEELGWLAMVESAFQPKVNSRVGAGGMWQFMKGTARRYGLRIDYYVDERYDWKKATRAAIAYLSDLYEMFDGNWPLAISAYNKGEYGLERAIASNGGERNLWRLLETPPAANRLPLETKKFYPKLLATILVAKNPQRHGMNKPRLEPEQSTYIQVAGSYSLRDLERATGLPKDSLRRLNPHLLRGITPPASTCDVLVPTNSRTRLAKAVEELPQYRAATHVVQRGETLSGIAQRYRVSVHDLMDTNNIRSAKRLQIGQRLAVPGAPGRSASGTRLASGSAQTYTVRRGDTPIEIAQRHGIALNDLLAWNKLDRSTPIYVGDTLYVAAQGSAKPSGEAIVHVVAKGEFPGKIAKRYGVPVRDLLAWNNLTPRSTIHIGDELKIYGAAGANRGSVRAASSEGGRETVHTVAPGESASAIAARYGVRTSDVLRWNKLTKRSVLQVGQELTIREQHQAGSIRLAAATQPANQRVEHVVRRGQSPWTIARRYGVKLVDLFRWNNWDNDPVLNIGDTVVVYTD